MLIDSFKNLKAGDTFQDDGFTSTSTSEPFVDRFRGANNELGADAYKMNIHIPKGKGRGIYIRPASEYPEEYEFLLQRGTQFKINNIDHNSKTMDISVIGNERKGL